MNCVQRGLERHRIMSIGTRCRRKRGRYALRISDEVPFAAEFFPVWPPRAGYAGHIRARRVPIFLVMLA